MISSCLRSMSQHTCALVITLRFACLRLSAKARGESPADPDGNHAADGTDTSELGVTICDDSSERWRPMASERPGCARWPRAGSPHPSRFRRSSGRAEHRPLQWNRVRGMDPPPIVCAPVRSSVNTFREAWAETSPDADDPLRGSGLFRTERTRYCRGIALLVQLPGIGRYWICPDTARRSAVGRWASGLRQ